MKDMKEITENLMIGSWARHFSRSPDQLNKLHETDAELVEISKDSPHVLAVTIDTIAEEIAEGLYKDPYTMGWVTVMATLSDLAAVGARPLGLVVSVSVDPARGEKFSDAIAQGMEDASRNLGVFILGGDTNVTSEISLTGCAFGLVPRKEVITRQGCKVGDHVFITGGIGIGNALGLVRLTKNPDSCFPEELYRPTARLKEGQILRRHASCCMDTSDGLLTTLDQLMRINGSGFEINCDWEKILAPPVRKLCETTKTPCWLMTAGPHGEFELLFTIPDKNVDSFLKQARSQGFSPIRLGRVRKPRAISLVLLSGQRVDVDMAPLRNLLQTVSGDLERYVREFKAFGERWGLETG